MTFRDVLGALWRWRVLVVVSLVAAGAVSYGLIKTRGVRYRAEEQMLLVDPEVAQEPAGPTLLTSQQRLQLLAANYAKVVTSQGFIDGAAKEANVNAAGAIVSGEAFLNTTVLRIGVTAPSPQGATAVATAVGSQLQRFVGGFSEPHAPQRVQALVLQQPAAAKSTANPIFILVVAFTAALAISGTVAVLAEAP